MFTMKTMMTYEDFEEVYMDAVERGTDMLCVWWTDDGDQVQMSWHPDTAYMHDQIAFEADMLMDDEKIEAVADWDMTFDEVFGEYYDTLRDAAKTAYEMYIEKVGEDYDA